MNDRTNRRTYSTYRPHTQSISSAVWFLLFPGVLLFLIFTTHLHTYIHLQKKNTKYTVCTSVNETCGFAQATSFEFDVRHAAIEAVSRIDLSLAYLSLHLNDRKKKRVTMNFTSDLFVVVVHVRNVKAVARLNYQLSQRATFSRLLFSHERVSG